MNCTTQYLETAEEQEKLYSFLEDLSPNVEIDLQGVIMQTEYNIVALLARRAGRVMTYAEIIQGVWGADDVGSTKKLQVHL